MAPPMNMSLFEQLRASGELPSPKGVAVAIIRLVQEEEVSIAELAKVIGGDPAFVGRVIKAANGLIAFSRRPVASVPEALMVLGLPAVRALATGFSLLSEHRSGTCRNFDYDAYWGFSLALGLGMQMVGQRTRVAPADELFSLGLLVRVGELALATLYPVDYADVLEQSRAEAAPNLLERERQAFATQHAELGAAMLKDWGVPRIFVGVVEHYEYPDQSGFEDGSRERQVLDSLAVARAFAEFCVADDAVRPALLARVIAEGQRLGLRPDVLLDDSRTMLRLWCEWIDLLELRTGASSSFPESISRPDEPTDQQVGELRRAFTGTGEEHERRSERMQERSAKWLEDARICVLVVDDEDDIRSEAVDILQGEDCSVIEASDINDGLDIALDLNPHMMVIGSGRGGQRILDFVSSLRRMRMGQPMHLLLRFGDDSEDTVVAALDAGADDVVVRSVARRLLAARLRTGLREVRLQRELEHDREELRCFAAELAVTNRKLREAALTDMLTGFRNRRYAIDRIEQEWSASSRSGRPLSCMVIDLDGLKDINDTFGHDAGDAALRRVAEALRGEIRGQDVICRTGGDEFLAICPGSSLDAAAACAERLREAVSRIELEFGGKRTRTTVSIGVAQRGVAVSSVDALMKLADRGAYLAKDEGRNAVVRMHGDTNHRDPKH